VEKPHIVIQVAVAGVAAVQIRAVHPITEAVAHPIALKAAVGEIARVPVKAKAAPGNMDTIGQGFI